MYAQARLGSEIARTDAPNSKFGLHSDTGECFPCVAMELKSWETVLGLSDLTPQCNPDAKFPKSSGSVNLNLRLTDTRCLTFSLKINYLSIDWELEAKLRVCWPLELSFPTHPGSSADSKWAKRWFWGQIAIHGSSAGTTVRWKAEKKLLIDCFTAGFVKATQA